jgi:acetyl-CoA acetyltransferase
MPSARSGTCTNSTTREQFAEIAVACREYALKNPDAQMKKPLTVEEYFKARLIVSPFGLFDCSLRSDGAGAVIVTSAERARDLKAPPVMIRGFGSFNNLTGWFADENMIRTAAKQSGETAYRMAGVDPADVSTAQLYDCLPMVLVQLEDYGFCKKGRAVLRAIGRAPLKRAAPPHLGAAVQAHVEGMLQIVGACGARHISARAPSAKRGVALVSAMVAIRSAIPH